MESIQAVEHDVDFVVNAEGLRIIAPFLGRKLYKVPLPGFSYLPDYEGLHQLDTAHVVTVFLFVASLISCTQFVRCLLIGEVSRPNGVTLNYGTYKFVVLALSVVILFADGFLFYYGTFSRTTSLFSDDTGVSMTALVLTAGSRVHDSVADMVDYLNNYPGVAEGKTQSALFVLSDMDDNLGDSQASKTRLLQSLETYARAKGVVGMYWVDHRLAGDWKRNLKKAGFRSFAVESERRAGSASGSGSPLCRTRQTSAGPAASRNVTAKENNKTTNAWPPREIGACTGRIGGN